MNYSKYKIHIQIFRWKCFSLRAHRVLSYKLCSFYHLIWWYRRFLYWEYYNFKAKDHWWRHLLLNIPQNLVYDHKNEDSYSYLALCSQSRLKFASKNHHFGLLKCIEYDRTLDCTETHFNWVQTRDWMNYPHIYMWSNDQKEFHWWA